MPFIGHAVGHENRILRGNPNRYLSRRCRSWLVRPHINGARYYLGYFPDVITARRARDAFLAKHRRPARFVLRPQARTASETQPRRRRR